MGLPMLPMAMATMVLLVLLATPLAPHTLPGLSRALARGLLMLSLRLRLMPTMVESMEVTMVPMALMDTPMPMVLPTPMATLDLAMAVAMPILDRVSYNQFVL